MKHGAWNGVQSFAGLSRSDTGNGEVRVTDNAALRVRRFAS